MKWIVVHILDLKYILVVLLYISLYKLDISMYFSLYNTSCNRCKIYECTARVIVFVINMSRYNCYRNIKSIDYLCLYSNVCSKNYL